MALLKDYPWKGYSPQHWRIIDRKIIEVSDTQLQTICSFGVWKNKTTYQSQPTNNKLQDLLPIGPVVLAFVGELTKTQCYNQAKLPVYASIPDPNNLGQFIQIDTNPLTGAIDDN